MTDPKNRTKILLVEDEPSIADSVRIALEAEGYSLEWKTMVSEALVASRKGGHQLFILDVGLPDGNGFSLCKDLRTFTQAPILFLTARNTETDRIVGLEFGADDYLAKPFSTRELVLRVRSLLKRSKSSLDTPGASLFKIDSEKLKIYFDGKALDLSRYEFKILKILVERPGVVFSREKLMEMVWEDPNMSLDRTVDTHMKLIRSKLKSIRPDLYPIETHRGVGYSLKEELGE